MFAHLFQQSIDTGEIPKEWSLANICPLYKKGDRSLACNYRPLESIRIIKMKKTSIAELGHSDLLPVYEPYFD